MSDTHFTSQSHHPSELTTRNAEDDAMPQKTDRYEGLSFSGRPFTRTVGYTRSYSSSCSNQPRSEVETCTQGFASSYCSGRSNYPHSRSQTTAEGPSRLELCDAVLKAVQTVTGTERGTIAPDIPLGIASGSFDGPDRSVELVFRVRVPASSITGLLKQNARVVKYLLLLIGKRS